MQPSFLSEKPSPLMGEGGETWRLCRLVAAVGVMFDIAPYADHHPHPTLPHQGGGLFG